jgi:hypothetical protein
MVFREFSVKKTCEVAMYTDDPQLNILGVHIFLFLSACHFLYQNNIKASAAVRVHTKHA